MKRRFRHSAVLFCAMILIVALLAGISPASYAAPLKGYDSISKAPSLADKAGERANALEAMAAEHAAAVEATEETPLKDRQLMDEVMKEAEAAEALAEGPGSAEPEESAAAGPVSTKPEDTSVVGPASEEAEETPAAGPFSAESEEPAVPEFSMADILKANDPAVLLEKYDGIGFIQMSQSEYGQYCGNYTAFRTDGMVYMEYPEEDAAAAWDTYDWTDFDWDLIEDWDDWAEFGSPDWDGYEAWDGYDELFGYEPACAYLFTKNNCYQLTQYDEEDSDFEITWYAYPGEKQESYDLDAIFPKLDNDSTLAEEITDVRLENGQLCVTTVGDAPAFCEISPLSKEIGSQIRYYLDPDTLEILYLECSVLLADGDSIPFMTQIAIYGEPDSDLFWTMLEKAVVYELEAYKNPRTVTVIYDPGTDLEESCSRIVEKGDYLTTYFKDGYTLYEDENKTMPFMGSDAQQDVKIYAFYGEDETDNYGLWTEGADPDALPAENDLDYAKISSMIYEANKLDAIFRNHDSVEYCLLFDENLLPNRLDYIYETPDMAYSETRDAALYATKDSFYQMWLNDDVSDLFYTFDFVNGYDPHLNAGYEIMPATEVEWFNPDCETPLDVTLEDGVIYLSSEYNEDLSRKFIREWLNEDYNGQIVTSMICADPESYELLALLYTVTDPNGEERMPLIFSINYDVSEPRACRNLRAIAERSAEQTADLKIVMNPGTDSETEQSMTVPIGSTVIYVSDAGMTLYEDAGCSIPAARWDHVSSQTFYLN